MFNFITRPFKRHFGVDKEYYRFIDDMFGFIPDNIELYKVALIHKSASQSVSGHHINNERLEYLGDAVIESVTSDFLFIEYPDSDEGFLTQMRSRIVSRNSLNEMARQIGLDKYIICHNSANVSQKNICGDAFEAMIGAIYLDKGYDFVNRLLINKLFAKYLSLEHLTESESDYKSRLIEWCQINKHSIIFRTKKGPNSHPSAPVFYTTILIDNIEVGHGSGDSKKSAEQNAACSVSHPLDDDDCSALLDKLDKLDNVAAGNAENTQRSGSSRSRRRRRRKARHNNTAAAESTAEVQSAPAPVAEAVHEQHLVQAEATAEVTAEAKVVNDTVDTAVEVQPEKKKRGRKPKARNMAAEEGAANETVAAEDQSTGEVQAEEKPKRKRGRKPKSEAAAAEVPAQTEEHSAEAEAKPRRKRGRKPKAAAETPTAEPAQTATDTAN